MSTNSDFANIIHNDWVAKSTADMDSHELTCEFPDGTRLSLTELQWFQLVNEVAEQCNWAIQVMTWHDVNRIVTEHVGWENDHDDETRRREFFEQGLARSETWRDTSGTWSPVMLMASLLSEMGYFDSPQEMLEWVAGVMTAQTEFAESLNDDSDDDDERGE